MSLVLDLHHDSPALRLDVEAPAGVITALVGPSGSGKTSILRAIAGLLRLRHARIIFGGRPWADTTQGLHVPTRLRSIGLVSQQYGLFPHLTAQRNVEAALTHLGIEERRARARECLALAHVSGLELRAPQELSGGQRQRVALARAIAREPQILLLDEPFSAVDRSTRKRLYLELRRLHEHLGTTVLLVTHDLDEAAQLASHLMLLRHGRILQTGPTSSVLTSPCSEEAARLLDIPNVINGCVAVRIDGVVVLTWGPYTLATQQPVKDWQRVTKFAVLPQNVLLVQKTKPLGTHLENMMSVRVQEIIGLGTELVVWLAPEGSPDQRLQMRLPMRAAHKASLTAGTVVTVSIRAADIIPLCE